jgi:hypothetical protein
LNGKGFLKISEYASAQSDSVHTKTNTALYEADIAEYGGGRFKVTGRDMSLTVIHADPERQFCHELTKLGVPDGPSLFYRADHEGAPSISFKSVYRAAKHITRLGTQFPKLKPRTFQMSNEKISRARMVSNGSRAPQDSVSEAPGYPSTLEKSGSVREAAE